MAHGELEDLTIYRNAERYCDRLYALVVEWPAFAKQTVGNQLVRAADSVGANVAEAYGRFHYADKTHFLYYARGSAYETIHWIRRAQQRGLFDDATAAKAIELYRALIVSLNRFIRRTKSKRPRDDSGIKTRRLGESGAEYRTDADGDDGNSIPF